MPAEFVQRVIQPSYSCTASVEFDLDGDYQINIDDLATLAAAWMVGGEGVSSNLDDLAPLTNNWLTCSRDPASECRP